MGRYSVLLVAVCTLALVQDGGALRCYTCAGECDAVVSSQASADLSACLFCSKTVALGKVVARGCAVVDLNSACGSGDSYVCSCTSDLCNTAAVTTTAATSVLALSAAAVLLAARVL